MQFIKGKHFKQNLIVFVINITLVCEVWYRAVFYIFLELYFEDTSLHLRNIRKGQLFFFHVFT